MSLPKRGSHINCCVYGCHTTKGRDKHLSFHTFPKENTSYVCVTNKIGIQEKVDRKKAWEIKLLMGKPTTIFMRVCSLHFKEDDFILPGVPCKFPRLKKTAVPSQNLPTKSIAETTPRVRRQLHIKRQRIPQSKATEQLLPSPEANQPTNEPKVRTLTESEKIAVDSLQQLINVRRNVEEKGTQVKCGDILIPFIAGIDTDAKLNSLTGLPSSRMLQTLVKIVSEHFTDKRLHKLTLKERIILTFMKIKTGLRYVVLAALFSSVTSKTCKIIFHDMISKLAMVLKPLIVWPSQDECRRNLPICFRNFANVRVVLDCTELAVQSSKNLCCRILTYSHYKGMQTIKFMTGVSPAGLITFVSDAYGGRASDKAIFEQSGIIDKLDMGEDAVMVDKGFHIEDITSTHHIKLIRPPFLRKKSQFSEKEAKENVDIAKARVHIERTNQRIKVFEILSKPLPLSLVPKIDEIFIVICAIVNLSAPILKDDKFLC